MFGRFQESELRIEVEASTATIRQCLLHSSKLRQWLPVVGHGLDGPEELVLGSEFTDWLGPIPVHHEVILLEGNTLELRLSQGIDGYHQWHWGDGWVQSSLAGISLLPLSLGQTASLMSLRHYLKNLMQAESAQAG